MGRWTRKPWVVNGSGILLIFLAVWFAAAFWTESSLGASFPILADLRSRIMADYGPDLLGSTLKSLQLTILGDVSSDSGLPGGDDADLGNAFIGLVPTATDDAANTEVPPTELPTDLPTDEPTATQTEPEITETETDHPTVAPTATHTPTSTKKPDPTATMSPLLPKVDCVEYIGGGRFNAHFGYKNSNNKSISIEIGLRNQFEPQPSDRGQPTHFEPGRTAPYPDAAFKVEFDGNNLKWELDGNSAVVSSESEHCDVPTPKPDDDYDAPVLSGGTISPSSGTINECSISVTINDLYVYDPPISSGIDWVKLKYEVVGFTSYIFSDPLQSCGGGFNPEGSWSGCFYGSIDIDLDSDWESPENDPFYVTVWSKVQDNYGYNSFLWHADYSLPASCDD